jgi:hypothetical protein
MWKRDHNDKTLQHEYGNYETDSNQTSEHDSLNQNASEKSLQWAKNEKNNLLRPISKISGRTKSSGKISDWWLDLDIPVRPQNNIPQDLQRKGQDPLRPENAWMSKLYTYILLRGTWYRSWLMHYATSWMVMGLIANEFNGFFNWHNPSSRNMAWGPLSL